MMRRMLLAAAVALLAAAPPGLAQMAADLDPAAGAEQAAAAAGDAAAGEKVFNRCKACHTVEPGKNRVGPSLHGVVGRKAGAVEGFKYSDPLKNSNITWTAENLDKYLADPKGFIPGNKMVFAGLPKPGERADVIAYLQKAGGTAAGAATQPGTTAAPKAGQAE